MGCSGCGAKNNFYDETDEKPLKPAKSTDIKIGSRMLVGENKDAITNNYKIEKKIGSGSFGKVYKVRHLLTDSIRAMKVIKKDAAKFQDDNHDFLKEIQILQELDHPNILKVFEYYIDDNYYYVITEYLAGGELYEQITMENCHLDYIQKNHYIDEGCRCNACRLKRRDIAEKVFKGIEVTEKVRHTSAKKELFNRRVAVATALKQVRTSTTSKLNLNKL